MTKYKVINLGNDVDIVTAEKAFVGHDGRLAFYNRPQRGETYGPTVAAFAPGSWTHFNTVNAED